MKYILLILIFASSVLSGCKNADREHELNDKEQALFLREQELLLREQALLAKEQEMLKNKGTDSNSVKYVDSVAIVNSAFPGVWAIKMTCSETTCSGSAIGDTKSEKWDIFYAQGCVTAQAMVGTKLIRVYNGILIDGNNLELVYENTEPHSDAMKIAVRLTVNDNGKIAGKRIITRDDCRIVYDLELDKI